MTVNTVEVHFRLGKCDIVYTSVVYAQQYTDLAGCSERFKQNLKGF